MDQAKAFDRVHRLYLWVVLWRKGVPDRFVRWLELLYKQAHILPTMDGYRGALVRQRQGLRQGCPLSLLLYVLALDPFLEQVECDLRLTGARFCGKGTGVAARKVVAVAYADDATFFVTTEKVVLKRHAEAYTAKAIRLPRGSRAPSMAVSTLEEGGRGTPASRHLVWLGGRQLSHQKWRAKTEFQLQRWKN